MKTIETSEAFWIAYDHRPAALAEATPAEYRTHWVRYTKDQKASVLAGAFETDRVSR